MSAGVHAEAIKGTFVVGEEWRDSKIKISQLADILPGNPQSPAKMGHSRNTEHVVCDCRGRAGRSENVPDPELGAWVLKMQIDQITALPHIPHLTHPEKQKGPTYPPYGQTIFTLKLMKFKLQGPPLVHASFKALERVLEMFHMVDYFFAKFAKERYFNHNQL